MGLRTKASSFRCLYEKGLRKRAEFFIQEEHYVGPSLEEQIFKKDYNLQTVLEISKEIYRSLDPTELINILLLTFMGQTRSAKGAFYLWEQTGYVQKVNKGFDVDFKPQLDWEQLKDISDFRGNTPGELELVLPLQGKNSIIAYVFLGNVGLQEIHAEEEVLRPLLSLGGIALENAMLYDDISRRFKQLEALYEIGDTLTQSPNLPEVLFLAFSALEHGLGISKLLLFLKKENLYVVFDGYGCREETHQKFSFSEDSEIFQMISEPGVHDLSDVPLDWENYFSPEDFEESRSRLFIPLQTYGQTNGVLAILAKDEALDAAWQQKLFELVGSYFASALYLVLNKSYVEEDEIDLSLVVEKLLSEQFEFSQKMQFPVLFAIVNIKNVDVQGVHSFLDSKHGKSIDLILGYKLLIIPCEDHSVMDEISEGINQLGLNLVQAVFSRDISSVDELIRLLGV